MGKDTDRDNTNLYDFFSRLKGGETEITSDELLKVIKELSGLQSELAQKEEERKKKLQAEEEAKKREELKRKQEEEERKKHVQEITCMDLPLDFENVFNSDKRTQGVRAESISDGLVLSLTQIGRVDVEYISAVTGRDYKEIISALRGSIYQNPETWNECFYKGWETAEEYLSGNLIKKLHIAQSANTAYYGYFEDNVKAISKLIPASVAKDKIYVTLGSPWLPADVIDDFFVYLFGRSNFLDAHSRTKHDEYTGSWEIPYKNLFNYSVKSYSTYGTRRIHAAHIIENTLNMRPVAVYDSIADPSDKKKTRRVLNKAETALAAEKQQFLIEKFKEWIWKDRARAERLEDIYAEKYGCMRTRRFDGSFLAFPGMSEKISLYPYQKNAVARILFTPNTLLAHDVGAGKTYVMIAAAMELKRMGLSQKNMFVVPNNIIGQWTDIFKQMYPSAKTLTVEPKTFTPDKRQKVLENIRDNDYDGIITAYSCFEMISLSRKFFIEQLEEEIDGLNEINSSSRRSTSTAKRRQKRAADELKKLLDELPKLNKLPFFDELGITRLFVDEAHNFKNVPIETKTSGVLGISSGGSAKCRDMLDKVRFVQKSNGGSGVVMATGTPVTNSVTDVFIMQTYLQSGELALLDLGNFDSWIGMFAESESSFEIDVDTNNYRMATRFSKFHNLPELTGILSSIADFHTVPSGGLLPDFNGYTDALIGRTYELMKQLSLISARADAVRSGVVSRTEDNMLKITTDGRKAALDIRLVDKTAGFSHLSKVARCAENVYETYKNTTAFKGTQLVFCDSSTPKPEFNLYDELTRLLCLYGVPRDEIAYVHDADTDKKRNELFLKVNEGCVRILLGSTFKLGTGVNVQTKLIAIHHLDVPWRPADMIQREGRILRQGNTNKQVFIYRYIAEGSFDAYSWQLLESKQRFISELLSGAVEERSRADVDDCVLNYAEVKALAVGNPLLKKRVETANELSRYIALQQKSAEARDSLGRELRETISDMADLANRIECAKQDIAFIYSQETEISEKERRELRSLIYSSLCDNELSPAERTVAVYRGFEVVLPANMLKEKKYIWLRHSGKYYVETSDNERGILMRLDKFLDGLEELLLRCEEKKIILANRKSEIEQELLKKDGYAEQIEYLKNHLQKLDKQLSEKKK